MNVEAFYASRQLQSALDSLGQGRVHAACEAVYRAKRAIDRVIREGADPESAAHAELCGCTRCHEAMLERL